jgi:hypothetical protein
MATLEDLEVTFIEEYESAMLLIKYAKHKSATILLSKALFALVDYIIMKKYMQFPKNHTERFRILEAKEQVLYSIVDSVWSKYTETYSKPSSNEAIIFLKDAIESIGKNNETISDKIKATIAKK